MFNLAFNKKVAKTKKGVARRQASRRSRRELQWPQLDRRLVLPLSIAAVLMLVLVLMPKDDFMPIEKIRISGKFQHLDSDHIEQQLKPFLGTGFFSVNLARIQETIQQQPWVSQVSVRRVWPNMLSVSVMERQPFARWDEQHLLSTRGQVFRAKSADFSRLPLVTGYQGQSAELLQRYVELERRFSTHGIRLSELREDSKGAMRLLLNDQLSVSLGSEDIEQKLRHMLGVYGQQIKTRVQHIQHIDFRYSNGFAITWNEDYLKKKSETSGGSNKNV